MIVDCLCHWEKYFSGPVWESAFAELTALRADTPEGDKKICGDDGILKVFSYETISPENDLAEMESHRRYFDIHVTITGAERIDWHSVTSLQVVRPYDQTADEITYVKSDRASASLIMTPGLFALFGPADAHMPRLRPAGYPPFIRKAVLKIPTSTLF